MRVKPELPLLVAASVLLVACGAGMTARQRGRKIVDERFAAAAPAVGRPAPDVAVFDASGKEHQLRALLKGNYAVLVLGCLT